MSVKGGGGWWWNERNASTGELCDLTTRTKNKKGNLSYCTLNYKTEIT